MNKRQKKKQFRKRYGTSPRQYERICRETIHFICEWLTDLCECFVGMVRDISYRIIQESPGILDDIGREEMGQGHHAHTGDGG